LILYFQPSEYSNYAASDIAKLFYCYRFVTLTVVGHLQLADVIISFH